MAQMTTPRYSFFETGIRRAYADALAAADLVREGEVFSVEESLRYYGELRRAIREILEAATLTRSERRIEQLRALSHEFGRASLVLRA